MPLRLPDIPFESWIADQQDRLQRLTESALPSLEFRAAALDAESKIPAYGAETDMALAEEMALQQEQERQRQQQEEEARRAAEEQRRQQAEFAQQQAAQAEAERQRGFMEEAWSTAKSLGIPTPGDVYDYFTGANSRPVGVGDNESSAGTFDSQPADMGGFAPEPTLPYADPTQIQSSDDFLAQTQSLNDSVFGPPDNAAPINGPELPPSDTPVYDTIINTGRNALETARRGLEMSSPSASIAFNAATGAGEAVVDAANRLSPSYMATNVGVAKGLEKTWNEVDRQSIAESMTETPEETRAREEALVPGSPALSRAIHLAKDLGQDVLEAKALTDITGSIWRENNLPMVYWGNDGFYVGKEKRSSDDVEINPGEFIAPDRLGFGGAVVPAMERQGARYGLGAAGAAERAAGRALRGAGSRLGQGLRALGEEITDTAGAALGGIGRGLRAADRALGSFFPEDIPEPKPSIGVRRLPDTRQVDGRARMFHGTGSGWDAPDPERFKEDGLFGPGYYLTSSPEVAGSYAENSSLRVHQDLFDRVEEAGRALVAARRADAPKAERIALDEEYRSLLEQWNALPYQERIATQGGNVRPVDLDGRMTFFHADEPVPQEDVQRIAAELRRRFGQDPDKADSLRDYLYLSQLDPARYRTIRMQEDGPLRGETFYNNLGRDFLDPDEMERRYQIDLTGDSDGDIKPDKKLVNDILSAAGFDGVYYRGGNRIPIKDAEGKPIRHDAVAIFPDKLDNVRNALTGEPRGSLPFGRGRTEPTPFEVFDAKTGDVARTFDNEADAARYAERVSAETGVFHDYGPSEGKQYAAAPESWQVAEQGSRNLGARDFEGLAKGMLPTHTAVGSVFGTGAGGSAGAAAGWESAPEDAPLSEKLDRATQGFLAGALVGQAGGAAAGAVANIAGRKIVTRALQSGAIDLETLSTHPRFENRMKALMLLAARDKADDELVDIPAYAFHQMDSNTTDIVDAGLRRLGLGRWNPEMADFEFNEGLTAGQIRERYKRTPVEELGRDAHALIVDALTGQSLRHARGAEARADIPAVTGRFNRPPDLTNDAGLEGGQRFGSEIWVYGNPADEVGPHLPDADTQPRRFLEAYDLVQQVAREFGVPEPKVYVVRNKEVNAYGFQHTGKQPVIGLTTGLIYSDESPDQIASVIAHELAHATDADRGRSLLEPVEKFIGRMREKFDDRFNAPKIEDDFDQISGDENYTTRDSYYDEADIADINPEDIPDIPDIADYDPRASRDLTPGQPSRGIWADRLNAGPDIPDGLGPSQVRNIERAFNEVKRLIARSQGERKTSQQMKFRRMADEAWATYQGMRERYLATVPPDQRPRVERSVRTPRDAGTTRPTAGTPEPEPRVDSGVVRGPEGGEVPDRVGSPEPVEPRPAPQTLEDFTPEPEPLPETMDPKREFSLDEVRTIVNQAKEEASADAATVRAIDGAAGKLMTAKKITGRTIENFLNAVGERRKIPNRETADQWTDRFLRKNGWLAPVDEKLGVDETVLSRRRAGDMGTATPEPGAESTPFGTSEDRPVRQNFNERLVTAADTEFLDRLKPDTRVLTSHFFGSDAAWDSTTMNSAIEAARRAGHVVEKVPYEDGNMGLMYKGPLEEGTSRGVQNLQGGAVGALAGAADPTAQDEDEEYETPIDRMAAGAVLGIIGRRKVLPSLQKGAGHPLATSARKRAFTNPTPGKAPEAGLAERIWYGITTRWTDDLSRLQQYQKDLAKEWEKQMGSKLPTSVLAAELKRLDPTRSVEMLVDERLKPHLKTFVRLGIPDEDINTYIANVHDIDIANATGNPGRTFPGGGGVADAIRDNQKFIAALKNDLTPAEFQEFEQAVQGVWDMGDTILKIKRDAGLITDEAYQTLRTEYPRYVPTRILDYINDENRVGFGKSLSITSNTIHEIGQQGTAKDALMPLPALLGAAYEAQVAAQKNKVFQAFIGMAAYANRLPTSVSGAALTERSQQRMRELMNGVTPLSSMSAKVPNGQVPVQGFINGKKVAFAVDKQLGDVVRFQSPITIPIFTGLMHAFRAGATARNPVFLTANLFLDLSSYMVREAARAGGPTKIPEVLSVYAATLNEFLLQPDAWKWIAAHEYRGDMARFLREGGGSSGQVGRGALRPDPTYWKQVDDLAKTMGFRQQGELEKEIGRLTREGWTPLSARTPAEALKMIGDFVALKPVEAVGERIELVPRVAAMRLAERRGANQLESVIAGRTTTIDFNKGGSWARTINQMIPFFNVGMQAIADIPRAYQENPAAWSATVAASVIAPMAIAEAWNNSTDQMRQDYKDIPDYIKDQGLVVMMPHGMKIGDFTVPDAPVDAQGNRRPQFFHFRFRQLAPVAQMTRRTLQDWVPGWKNDVPEAERRTLYDEIMSGVSAISPVGANSPTDLVTSLTPLGIQTALQLAMDWDSYRGKRIKSAYADERSSPLSQGISRLSQGTFAEMTPAQAEFATRDIGSGYAGMLHGASEILFGKEKGGDRVLQDVPLAGGLFSRFVKSSIGGNAESARESTLTDSADKILRKHDIRWRPSPADPEIENVPLLRGEYAAYQRQVNEATDKVIQELARDPKWVALPQADKEVILKREVARDRDKVRRDFLKFDIPKSEQDKRIRKLEQEGKLPMVGVRK